MRAKLRLTILLTLSLAMMFTLAGCRDKSQSGSTYVEPDITVEYLSTEYAEQLLRDGAVHIFGTINIITDENGNPFLEIAEKEFVTDANQPNGFYVADKNLNSRYPLSFEARTTHLAGGTSIPTIMTSENFVKAVTSDLKLYGTSNPEYAQYKLYDIYVIGEQVEMILARYIP